MTSSLVVDDQGGFRGAIRFEHVPRRDGGNGRRGHGSGIPTARDDGEIRTTLEMMLKEERVWLPVVDEEKTPEGDRDDDPICLFLYAGGAGPGEIS